MSAYRKRVRVPGAIYVHADQAPPAGSEYFDCPRCGRRSLSAGDGCNNCGYGYDDEPLPSDDEIDAMYEEYRAEEQARDNPNA